MCTLFDTYFVIMLGIFYYAITVIFDTYKNNHIVRSTVKNNKCTIIQTMYCVQHFYKRDSPIQFELFGSLTKSVEKCLNIFIALNFEH